jgi:hypothetical protein
MDDPDPDPSNLQQSIFEALDQAQCALELFSECLERLKKKWDRFPQAAKQRRLEFIKQEEQRLRQAW